MFANPANTENFIQAFFEAIGVPMPVRFGEESSVINASLAPHVMEVQRVANNTMPEIEAHMLSDWLVANIPKQPALKYDVMSAEERNGILDFFRDSNHRLAGHMGRYDLSHYTYEVRA